MVLAYIMTAVILVSLLSLVGVLFLVLQKGTLKKYIIYIVSFAAGAMLAAAFLDLLPEAVKLADNARTVFMVTLASIVVFFLLEKFLYWFHCHDGHCEFVGSTKNRKKHKHDKKHWQHHHIHPVGFMNLIGDGIHNFVDGALIAGAFMASIPLGIVASIAVILHEIPQEIGDFAILIYAGLTPQTRNGRHGSGTSKGTSQAERTQQCWQG